MSGLSWLVVFFVAMGALSYHRAALWVWTASLTVILAAITFMCGISIGIIFAWILFLAAIIPLHVKKLRHRFISKPLLTLYRNVMPTMSRTEREAIAAGTVTWEGDLFRGNPNWKKLLAFTPPTLTAEEQAFIDGPVNTLCKMINDWDITHNRADLPPEMWTFIKEQGFFGLIIPKEYGGKAFSAYAHSQILVKVSGLSVTVSTTIAVPNSLGPAELILHYGTDEQKQYYLPRLATGEEIPCFALTSPVAGSDAGAMTDHGIVCWGEHEGKKVLGIRLTWDKRYITLAPIATVIGLAFKLYDPDHLIGKKEEIGITCALIPRHMPGITIGRRHFPLNTPFQNGPTQGRDVFIPIDWIIGGVEQAGKGWRMLMECLAAGRAITLPSSAVGGAKVMCYTTGAYARIRKQFNLPIGKFEGIEEPLTRIGAYGYVMDAARTFVTGFINAGEKPSVASAIVKYHVTELGRKVSCDAMDIHGGKGICLGPHNYLGRSYESSPIAITVEGANILTRCLIIFGQGAIRCHPYVFEEMEAAKDKSEQVALARFDRAFMKHIAFGISNVVRSLFLATTAAIFVWAPRGKTRRYFQYMTRFSSAFALITDVSMLSIGGALKRKENLSARLGDILSYLYLLSATLKRFHDEGSPEDDLPLIDYICKFYLFEIQQRFDEVIKNYPNRWLAILLRIFIFPLGHWFALPNDQYNHKIAALMIEPSATRLRLSKGVFDVQCNENVLASVQDALEKTIVVEPIEKLIKAAKREDLITGYSVIEQAQSALAKGIIDAEQFASFMQADEAKRKVIAVDDFSNAELGCHPGAGRDPLIR